MKKITMQALRDYGPCYDPTRYLPESFEGTILDILDHKEIPFEDKLLVILRTELVSEKLMRLFAVWCYRQTLLFIKNPDPRSVECANISEKYANGEASLDELSAAESAAWSAAESAAESVQKNKLREMIIAGIKTGDTKC